MSSIKKVVLIPVEKYLRILSQDKETIDNNADKNKKKNAESTRPAQILETVESEHSESSHDHSIPTPAHSENETAIKPKWLLGMPPRFKRNVQALLEHLQDHKDVISWNDRGEILYKGRIITGSNLSDLLRDSQKEYKYLDPYGDREFYRAWAEVNIPESLLGNEKRKTEVRWYKKNPNTEYLSPPPGIPQRISPKRKAQSSPSKSKWLRL